MNQPYFDFSSLEHTPNLGTMISEVPTTKSITDTDLDLFGFEEKNV